MCVHGNHTVLFNVENIVPLSKVMMMRNACIHIYVGICVHMMPGGGSAHMYGSTTLNMQQDHTHTHQAHAYHSPRKLAFQKANDTLPTHTQIHRHNKKHAHTISTTQAKYKGLHANIWRMQAPQAGRHTWFLSHFKAKCVIPYEVLHLLRRHSLCWIHVQQFIYKIHGVC